MGIVTNIKKLFNGSSKDEKPLYTETIYVKVNPHKKGPKEPAMPKDEIARLTKGKKFRNSLERQMYINNDMGCRDTKDHLDYQDALLSRVNAANEKYKKDGNLNALISEYEFAFRTSKPSCASSQNLKLADFYMEAGMNDKAWRYLNQLYSTGEAPKDKIRFKQASLLKKEKRYAYAIEMYMLGYLYKHTWNKEMFLKDISSSANKLSLSDNQREFLASLVERQVKSKKYNEDAVSDNYRKTAKEWGIYQ